MATATCVDPGLDPFYGGYYVEGLRACFGAQQVCYGHLTRETFERAGVAFEVRTPGLRAYIDPTDEDGYDEAALAWCDVYAKVNMNPLRPPARDAHKVIPAGPGFGVRAWSAGGALSLLLRDGGRWWGREPARTAMWGRHFARAPLAAYVPRPCESAFVFFVTSVWAPEDACNGIRSEFIQAAREVPGIRFEGGFAPAFRDDVPTAGLEAPRRYRTREYLSLVARSTVVLNSPAVLDCHGWKLAEYLALGKAIITTPLSRALPAPLEHGTHLHVVPAEREAMAAAIADICADATYRRHLEEGAARYFRQHLAPQAVIARILASGGRSQEPR